MRGARRGVSVALAMLALIAVPGGCGSGESVLDSKIWPCDPHATADQCGTSHGRPMTCYSAEHLGGQAFCAETCDPAVGSTDPIHFACVAPGALLHICDPGNTKPGCPDGLSCYRNSLSPLDERGLCLPMTVCSGDPDCAGSGSRSVCLGPLVAAAYSRAPLSTNNLQCLQLCAAVGDTWSVCEDGEVCLPEILRDASAPPICAPRCNLGDSCPPNFTCLRDISPAYPSVCLPGFPGSRCTHDEECAIGDCRDTGAGFRICTLDCDPNHDNCSYLDGPRGPAFCADSMCVIKSPFTGVNCTTDSDCASDQKCSSLNPYDPSTRRARNSSECHRLCDGPGQCSQDGRVPYLCLKDGESYSECYPADFGLPCAPGVERCMGNLVCMKPNHASEAVQATCTSPCAKDLDCTSYNLTEAGQCRDGVCQLRQLGDPCSTSAQCLSQRCGPDGTCQ